jgi:prenyltransferase beta subunit
MKVILQMGNPEKLIWSSPTTFYFPERHLLHPKLHTKFVEDLLRDIGVYDKYSKEFFQQDTIYIISNSIYIMNRLRISKKKGEIDLEIQFESFDDKGTQKIRVDKNGSLEYYPIDLDDENRNLLLELI